VGFFAGRSEFGETAEAHRLVVHVGEARISREGRTLPADGGAAGRAHRRSQEYLRVPEAWQRSFQRLRSANDTLALVFTVPYIMLLGVAVWIAFRLTNAGQPSWRERLCWACWWRACCSCKT